MGTCTTTTIYVTKSYKSRQNFYRTIPPDHKNSRNSSIIDHKVYIGFLFFFLFFFHLASHDSVSVSFARSGGIDCSVCVCHDIRMPRMVEKEKSRSSESDESDESERKERERVPPSGSRSKATDITTGAAALRCESTFTRYFHEN